MPDKKLKEPELKQKYICEFCNKEFQKESILTKHESDCPNNPYSKTSLENLKVSRGDIEKIDSQINDPRFEKLDDKKKNEIISFRNVLVTKLQGDELRQQHEKEIEMVSDDNREKRALTTNYQLQEKINKFESGADPIDKLVKIKTIEALDNKNTDNVYGLMMNMMNQNTQTQLESIRQNHESQMKMQEQLYKVSLDKNQNDLDILDKFGRYEETINKLAKKLGYTKSEGDKTGMDFMAEVFGNILDKNMPSIVEIFKQKGEQKAQQPQQQPFDYPPQAEIIPNDQFQNPEFEAGASPDLQVNKPSSPPQPHPQQAPERSNPGYPTDQELLDNPALDDDSRPSNFRGNNDQMDFAMNQYLKPSKKTSPQTASP